MSFSANTNACSGQFKTCAFRMLSLLQLSMSALAAGWNALAYDLRQRDLLSNRELACITFEQLLLSEAQEQELRGLGLLPVLPARCGNATCFIFHDPCGLALLKWWLNHPNPEILNSLRLHHNKITISNAACLHAICPLGQHP